MHVCVVCTCARYDATHEFIWDINPMNPNNNINAFKGCLWALLCGCLWALLCSCKGFHKRSEQKAVSILKR